MKKVCFYMDSIFQLGGIQRIVTTLANNLIEQYDITILCSYHIKDINQINYELNQNLKVDYLQESNIVYRIINVCFKPIRFLAKKILKIKSSSVLYENIFYKCRFDEIQKIKKYFSKNNFDYILAEGLPLCIFLSFIKNDINQNTTTIGCWHSSFDNYIKNYPNNLIKKSLMNLDKTIVLSNYDKNKIKEIYHIETDYIYNPILKESLDQPVSNKTKTFIAVGRYAKIKGFDKLIKAFKIFNIYNKEWKLKIVGEGPQRNNLQKIINENNLSEYVKLTGQTDNISKYYMEASIFLMTSEMEGFGMVLVEAMKYELPIIAFDVPVYHEILPSDVPIIEQGNIKNFANKMLELANDTEYCKRIIKNYDKYLNQFYIENIINDWKKILM